MKEFNLFHGALAQGRAREKRQAGEEGEGRTAVGGWEAGRQGTEEQTRPDPPSQRGRNSVSTATKSGSGRFEPVSELD